MYQIKRETDLPPGFRQFLSIPRQSMLYNSTQFVFGHPAIDNMMLCRQGILHCDDSIWKIVVCHDCSACVDPKSGNTLARLPKYALTNKLFLGDLPERFKDVTWVEEQVCALYQSTVYVYRLYHSDDPQDPYIAKGNSCAHPQNTVSTAKILPHTPADVAGCISVVFTASNKFVPEAALTTIFRVRKHVIRDLLHWLHLNNPMYKDFQISESHLSIYGGEEDDQALPGIRDRVIVNVMMWTTCLTLKHRVWNLTRTNAAICH